MTEQADSDTATRSSESTIEETVAHDPSQDERAGDDDVSEMLASEIEIELESEAIADDDFDEAVRKALASVEGELLFQVHVEHAQDYRHVAAISIGSGAERKLALIILPTDGGETRIEPAESSPNPLAPLARSYIGLVEAYKAAA
jgi:hypothetical protein